MHEERLTEGPLHDDEGVLADRGWAVSALRAYDRSRVRAPSRRIKEWERYTVGDDEYAVCLTLADLGYCGVASALVVDLLQGASHAASAVVPLPLGRFRLPASPVAGTARFEGGRACFLFEVGDGRRRVEARFAGFDGADDLAFEAVLDCEPRESLVVADSWERDPLSFCYSQKTVAMRAQGSFKKGLLVHGFSPERSFGALDWGRGVLARDIVRFGACAQGWQDGAGGDAQGTHRFGLSLGSGLGDGEAASENMVLVDDEVCKLGRVSFDIPRKTGASRAARMEDRCQLMRPWRLSDDEGRLDLTFTPVVDRADRRDLGVVRIDLHRVFGRFDGAVALDDGSSFSVANVRGFSEASHTVC